MAELDLPTYSLSQHLMRLMCRRRRDRLIDTYTRSTAQVVVTHATFLTKCLKPASSVEVQTWKFGRAGGGGGAKSKLIPAPARMVSVTLLAAWLPVNATALDHR